MISYVIIKGSVGSGRCDLINVMVIDRTDALHKM